jgi:cytochrome c553/glyoxylase-like metal-dependent hydrolase (beta-lactamase superfamily II)
LICTGSEAAGDKLRQAEQTAKTVCVTCHGLTGISENNEWPNLAGQKFGFLLKELRNFRDRKRTNDLMSPTVASLTDEELTALAKYYSQQKPASAVVPPSIRESVAYKRGELIAGNLCIACHGQTGISIREDWPNLAGQKSDYLYKQMFSYRDKTRASALMNAVLHVLQDDEIPLLTDYYSNLTGCNDNKTDSTPCNLQSTGTEDRIKELGNGIYTYLFSIWNPVFLVTSEGIIVIDPTTVESAQRLKEELHKRFNLPVKYVILTHAHRDHSGGTSVFADEAAIISHEKTKINIENRNQSEIKVAERVNRIAQLDPVPDITFTDRMTLHFGGKTLELEHIEPFSHSSGDVIFVTFVEDKLLVAIDTVNPNALPFMDFRSTPLLQHLEDVKEMEKRDFKYYSNGHATTPVTKQAVTAYREILEFLYTSVQSAIDKGQSIEEAKRSIHLPARFVQVSAEYLPPGTSVEALKKNLETRLIFNIDGAYNQLMAHKEGREVFDIHNKHSD